LDRWLVEQSPDCSRSEIQRWIEQGRVTLDGALPNKSGLKLAAGQTIEIELPFSPGATPLTPLALPLTIVYEDHDLLVIDKPAGLVVHPAPGHANDTLVNAILYHVPDIAGVGGERRPGLVHRLDKETSGLLVAAKNDVAQRFLQSQFKARRVYKEYLALVEGRLDPLSGRIDVAIGRHLTERKRQAVFPKGEQGRPAITDYDTIAIYRTRPPGEATIFPFSLVRVVIHTGRTHQIRVHFAWIKHPIVGDRVYGAAKPRLALDRQFLHAHRLRFRLPSGGEEREFVSPLPADLQSVVERLERAE
jgi:23S rRNA pseudouridine1911/1915/1917 synthase